jgi:hypothetical protein
MNDNLQQTLPPAPPPPLPRRMPARPPSPPPVPETQSYEEPPPAEVIPPPIAAEYQPPTAEPPAPPPAGMREPWLQPGWQGRLLRKLQASASFCVSTFVHAVFIVVLGLLFITEKLQTPELAIVVDPTIEEAEVIESFAIEAPETPTLAPAGGGTQLEAASTIDAQGLPMFGEVEVRDAEQLELAATTPRGVLDAELLGDGAYGHTGRGGKGGLFDGSFEGMVEYAQDNGLDIVIVYDSTGSMGADIAAVKERIERIGANLLKKIPSARLGICTYKDKGDIFVAEGLPLTHKIDDIRRFLDEHGASGGGDLPEAVEAGLGWAVQKNEFRKKARKVILVFGDAPPHPQDVGLCCALADEFFRYQKGIVTTITVHRELPLPELQLIAKSGHGSAYAMADSRRLMEELIVQAFGEKHRAKAVKFFELDKEGMVP